MEVIVVYFERIDYCDRDIVVFDNYDSAIEYALERVMDTFGDRFELDRNEVKEELLGGSYYLGCEVQVEISKTTIRN